MPAIDHDPHHAFAGLEILAVLPNLLSAWQHVRQNQGAPGMDGVTIQAFAAQLDHHLADIAKTLISGRYRPSPLRAVDIPKPDTNGLRTLGIPTVQDRVVLQAIAQILTPLWEPHFSPYSFAFREGRSALDAVLLAQQRLQSGQHWIVDLDIEKFFDNVDHVRLMQRLAQRVDNPNLLDLIADFLRAGLVRDGVVQPTRVGIAQGSPLSPLLANIVLDELDQEYARHGWSFVRYADDCILFARSEAEGLALLEFTREFLADRLRLRLNPVKTRVVRPAEVGFLGFTYRVSRYGRVRRRIVRSALEAFRREVQQLTRPRPDRLFEEIVADVAQYFRGWATYFRFTQDNTLRAAHAYACAALRACAWFKWRTPSERLRQLQRLGVPEDAARAAAFALDFPDAADDPPILRRVLANAFFERNGLILPPTPDVDLGPQPLSAALSTHQSTRRDSARPVTTAPADGVGTEERQRRRALMAFLARRLHLYPTDEEQTTKDE